MKPRLTTMSAADAVRLVIEIDGDSVWVESVWVETDAMGGVANAWRILDSSRRAMLKAGHTVPAPVLEALEKLAPYAPGFGELQ